jgi:hypothetical protein
MFKCCSYAGATCLYGPEPSWSWSYGSLIDYYIDNQCLSLLTLWVRIALRRCVLDITCDNVAVTRDRSVVFSGYFGFLHQ